MGLFGIGDYVTFTYSGVKANDKYPKVLVLHDNWQGNIHGLNFNYLTADEINTIRCIIDPVFRYKYGDNLQKKNPSAYRELESIATYKPVLNITGGPPSSVPPINSPRDFYYRIIRPFILPRGWDPYRLYNLNSVSGMRIMQRAYHMTGKDEFQKIKQQIQDKIAEYPQEQQASVLQWYKDKFAGMRGPKMPTRMPTFRDPDQPENEPFNPLFRKK